MLFAFYYIKNKEHVMGKKKNIKKVVDAEQEILNGNNAEDPNESVSAEAESEKIESSENGEKPKANKKEKSKKALNTIVNVVLVMALIFASVCIFISYTSTMSNGVPSLFGVKLLTVQTDSMKDTIMPGDLIIDVDVNDASLLEVDDIITFRTLIQGKEELNTHRIVRKVPVGEYYIFETKGDNSDIPDYMTVHQNEIVGKYVFRIPAVGAAIDFMQTPLGFFLVVVLPVLIFFVYHLIQFFRVLFEYQNVKMLIKYEQERGANEDIIAAAVQDEQMQEEIRRAAYEAELREKLKAELLADIEKEKTAQKEQAEENEQKDVQE